MDLFFFLKRKSKKRNNTWFYQDSANSKVTKGRAFHAKWTAYIYVQSSTDECKYFETYDFLNQNKYICLHTRAACDF